MTSFHYLDAILQVLDILAGEREDSDKRRAIRAALYEGNRKNNESLAQYALCRDGQFSTASQYMVIPDELRAFMLEEQSGLTKQGLQNLRVLTDGKHEYSRVRRALQVLDIGDESLFKAGKPSFLVNPDGESNKGAGDSEEDLLNADTFLQITEKDWDEARKTNQPPKIANQ